MPHATVSFSWNRLAHQETDGDHLDEIPEAEPQLILFPAGCLSQSHLVQAPREVGSYQNQQHYSGHHQYGHHGPYVSQLASYGSHGHHGPYALASYGSPGGRLSNFVNSCGSLAVLEACMVKAGLWGDWQAHFLFTRHSLQVLMAAMVAMACTARMGYSVAAREIWRCEDQSVFASCRCSGFSNCTNRTAATHITFQANGDRSGLFLLCHAMRERPWHGTNGASA